MGDNILKIKKIRKTSFRVQVLEVFKKYKNAIDVAQIEKELGEHDRVTLYRTINTFIDAGIIHEIALTGHSKKLALCDTDCEVSHQGHSHEHVHFECLQCQEIFCLDVPSFPKLNLKGFQINSVEVAAKGICNSCN